eukprot:TRINITY_DN30418_c0_g1_i1.p1 TRINITY_DN30418_c0_g1~~TRINITY_DN30418_c0_g1_i1.p1  ORF type:complete len:437 (+),score=39.62 TRINITY_DN30418_c0_g1_i1:186-1313(+)
MRIERSIFERSWQTCFARRRPTSELHLEGLSKGLPVAPALRALNTDSLSNLRILSLGPAPELLDTDLGNALSVTPLLVSLRLLNCPRLTGAFLRYAVSDAKSGLNHLESLICSGCSGLLDSEAGASAAALPSLLQLGFAGSQLLTDQTALALSVAATRGVKQCEDSTSKRTQPRLQRLVHLDLSQASLTDAVADLLSNLVDLKALVLSRTSLGSVALSQLASRLKLRACLPNRPKVLVRNLSIASELRAVEVGSPPVWANDERATRRPSQGGAEMPVTAALSASHARHALVFSKHWPEVAVRHAVALQLCEAAASSATRDKEVCDGELRLASGAQSATQKGTKRPLSSQLLASRATNVLPKPPRLVGSRTIVYDF